jgi:DNA-binding FadR family transcriptional regulator
MESELSEARQRLSSVMMGSIALTSPEESLRQLQEENQLLKQQLSRSMTSLISSAKVRFFLEIYPVSMNYLLKYEK